MAPCGYEGPGLQYGRDACAPQSQGTPDECDVEALRQASRGRGPCERHHPHAWRDGSGSFAGDGPMTAFPLRPGVDGWSVDLAQRMADASEGRLQVVQDRDGCHWLIASRDRERFERAHGRPDEGVNVWGPGDALDYLVRDRDIDWINVVMRVKR
jgi:hypothetical protein